ncbi:hypothetical protein DENSPDRAFT_594472 [Dentipellis sp. KUC8613]|nr:hypothetical protein DENSPDRAFT_594472 [Dentipellis sp. KUC8613]
MRFPFWRGGGAALSPRQRRRASYRTYDCCVTHTSLAPSPGGGLHRNSVCVFPRLNYLLETSRTWAFAFAFCLRTSPFTWFAPFYQDAHAFGQSRRSSSSPAERSTVLERENTEGYCARGMHKIEYGT